MKIISGTEPISVEHPVFLIFAQPGWGKTSLGYSTKDPLLLDFDKGAHRAVNRRDTLVIDAWKDVADPMESGTALDKYHALTVDTVGRCLDVMTAHIAFNDPKKAPGGNLSLQGWGSLKTMFRNWITQLRTKGKDVLLVAHDKEDKDGDTRIVRPDIVGASLGEVMKVADFVGYGYMAGKRRILDFNPTDRWVGKNPGAWEPFEVPAANKAQAFMAELYDRGREALGKISERSSDAANQVEVWRGKVAAVTTAEQANDLIPFIKALTPTIAPQVSKLLLDHAAFLNITFDKKAKQFVAPQPSADVDEAVGF